MNVEELLARADLPEQPPLVATITLDVELLGTITCTKARYCTDGPFPHWHAIHIESGTALFIAHNKFIHVEFTR